MGRHQAACAHARGRLVCTREPHPNSPRAHVYISSDGSSIPDRHNAKRIHEGEPA